jgi:alkylation response protein AidB-like acyl-CoA dehydrogenase
MLLHDALKDEHDELRRAARRLCAEHASARAALATETGHDPALWRRMADLGWPGLIIPEAYGGAGLGLGELGALLEELGRSLAPTPFLATAVLAPTAILRAGDEAQRRARLPGLAAGTTLATLAVLGETVVRAVRLHGEKRFVVDGHAADLLVVAAGDDLYLVDGADPGITRQPTPTLDGTRRLCRVGLDGARAERLAGDGAAALAHTLDVARVALAAEQLGGADRCLDMAVDYAKTRVQFGRAIGSFQAVKHTLADMMVAVEAARSACRYAAWVADTTPAELPLAAAIARQTATQTYLHCAGANIQVHGGVGFTWEHDAHLYFKRARAAATLFAGDARAAVLGHLEL